MRGQLDGERGPPPEGDTLDQFQADLESLVETCERSATCEATFTVETIRADIRALLQLGPTTHGATALTWHENGIVFNVLGPPDVFRRDEALAVANDVQVAIRRNIAVPSKTGPGTCGATSTAGSPSPPPGQTVASTGETGSIPPPPSPIDWENLADNRKL